MRKKKIMSALRADFTVLTAKFWKEKIFLREHWPETCLILAFYIFFSIFAYF